MRRISVTASNHYTCPFSFSKPSVFELVRSPDFANLPLIVEDFVKDNGGSYTGEFAGSILLKSWLVNVNFLKVTVSIY